jgi:hypothetical protein
VFCQGDLFSHLRFSPISRRQIRRETETHSRTPDSGGGVRIRETETARPATETGSAGVWSGVFSRGTYCSLLTVLPRQSVTGFDGNRNPRIRSWEPGRPVCGIRNREREHGYYPERITGRRLRPTSGRRVAHNVWYGRGCRATILPWSGRPRDCLPGSDCRRGTRSV